MILILHSYNSLYNIFHFLPLLILSYTATAKSLQSCPTLCNPIDSSPPGSPVPGILQARTLEWVAISVSNAWKWKVKVKSLSHVQLFTTPWTAAYQAPPSMEFSRQEYWSGVPLVILKMASILRYNLIKWWGYKSIYIWVYIYYTCTLILFWLLLWIFMLINLFSILKLCDVNWFL